MNLLNILYIIMSVLLLVNFDCTVPAKPQPSIEYFYYSYNNSFGEGSYYYLIEDGKLQYDDYYGIDNPMITSIDPEAMEKLEQICSTISDWDGFSETDEDVLDGDGFSLTVNYADGCSINAYGSNAYPEGYSEFDDSIKELFEPYAEAARKERLGSIIEAGINGQLDGFIVTFIQNGSSGDDRYEFFSYHRDDGSDYYEVSIQSESGEFIEQGQYGIDSDVPSGLISYEGIETLLDKYEIIRWFGYDEASEDYNNSEWFQLCFWFDDGFQLDAMGSEKPDHYDEFRSELLTLLVDSVSGYKQVNG